jgi:hypothetical protein
MAPCTLLLAGDVGLCSERGQWLKADEQRFSLDAFLTFPYSSDHPLEEKIEVE